MPEVAVSLYAHMSRSWDDHKTAISSVEGKVSYGELRGRVRRAASWLRGQGLQPGDVLAVQMPRSVRFFDVHLAALALGVVTLPLNPAYPASEVEFYLQDSEARLAIVPPGAAAFECPTVVFDEALEQIWNEQPDVELPAPPEPSALALLLYTSGTTGRPKGAMLEHQHVHATVEALHQAWALSADDVLIHALPLFHVHGLIVAALGALRAGAELAWMDRFDPSKALDLLEARGTVFMGVPTFYSRFLDLPRDRVWDLSRVRLVTSGSAPLPARDHQAMYQRFGVSIVERYGMTEVGIVLSNPLGGPHRPGTVGLPLPGCRIDVVDPESGSPVAAGIVGEIAIAGPSVFRGYRGSEAAFVDGWLRSGDLAVRDPDGWVTIVGRSKDMILSGGLNVYPAEVERALLEDPAVAEAAVVGVPDPDLGERVVAVVVPRHGTSADLASILGNLRADLAPYKCPKWVAARKALPKNALGKVLKAELRRELGAPQVRPARPGDVDRIVRWNLAMALETEGLRLPEVVARRGVERVFREDVGARYFVAEIAGEPVGQCMVTTEWSDWRDAYVWWFQSVYVPRGWRQRGVFRTLYHEVRLAAIAQGAAGLRLYVDKTNHPAQAVYTNLGMDGSHYAVFEAMFSNSR